MEQDDEMISGDDGMMVGDHVMRVISMDCKRESSTLLKRKEKGK